MTYSELSQGPFERHLGIQYVQVTIGVMKPSSRPGSSGSLAASWMRVLHEDVVASPLGMFFSPSSLSSKLLEELNG